MAAFPDPVFHPNLIPYEDDYEMAKQVVIEAMQQIDLLMPDASAMYSLIESRDSSSATNLAPAMLFKLSLMNITRKQASPPLSIQPLSVDLEMATFLILVRDNESIDFQSF